MNKNFIIAGGVVFAIGLAVAIGVTLVDEPLDGNLPEGETTVNGDILPEFASENDDNIARGLAAPTFSAPNENSEIVSLQKNQKNQKLQHPDPPYKRRHPHQCTTNPRGYLSTENIVGPVSLSLLIQ